MKKAIKFFVAVILLNCLFMCELNAQDEIIWYRTADELTGSDNGAIGQQMKLLDDGQHWYYGTGILLPK